MPKETCSVIVRSRRDSLLTRVAEMDDTCGTESLVLLVSPEKASCYYYGHRSMIDRLFGRGIAARDFGRDANVRPVRLKRSLCYKTFKLNRRSSFFSSGHCVTKRLW